MQISLNTVKVVKIGSLLKEQSKTNKQKPSNKRTETFQLVPLCSPRVDHPALWKQALVPYHN